MNNPTILVPTDLSRLGNKAFELAAVYQKLMGGVVIPVHALTEPVWPEGIRLPSLDEKNSRELIRFVRRRCTEEAEKWIPSEFVNPSHITYGDPVRVITEKSSEADLVVMSAHGRTGFQKFLLGSVAGKVCRLSKTPVMVTIPKDKIQPFSKILITTDLSDASCEAFKQAADVLRAGDASADLLHVVSLEFAGKKADREQIKKEAEENLNVLMDKHFSEFSGRVTPRVVLSDESVHHAINSHINSGEYNLLVMASAGRTGLNYALMGSTATQMIQLARVPVLIIRPKLS